MKNNLYYPSKQFQEKAWLKNKSIYKEASRDPIKFWEKLAEDLVWKKKWTKVFSHKPPYFKWFEGAKINITENCLDNHLSDKPALIWEPESIGEKPRIISYNQLFKEVNKLANALKRLGVKKGDKIGIYLPMIPETVISMLACARIGAVHTVVFSAFSSNALRIRLQDTRARILITADGYHRRGKIINLKESADKGIKQTKIKKVIVVKRAGNKVAMKKRDIWYKDLVKKEKEECKAVSMNSEDLLFILYTSGSTGKPKGCEHICGGYAVQAKATGKYIFDLNKEDVMWCTADFGWVTGHTYAVYSPLLNGAASLIFEGAPDWPKPDRWTKIIEKYKATILYTAPTATRMFEKYGSKWLKKNNLKSLRLLGSVGEPIDETNWQWYFKEVGRQKCPIVDTWWQTETGGVLISSLPGIGPFKPSYAGLPFPGIKVGILDDKGKACPFGQVGNLVILPPFSPGLFRGIYRNPKKYLKTYWNQYGKKIYFTSDGALQEKNGLIRIIGRIDDVIKTAGHRLSTGELEDAINSHPDIAECAVVGIPDEIKGEVPVAFVVCKGKRKPDVIQKEITAQIKKQIGPIALLKKVYPVIDLPKTRSGKIMRRILRKLFSREDLGDLSTLANAESVDTIKEIIKND